MRGLLALAALLVGCAGPPAEISHDDRLPDDPYEAFADIEDRLANAPYVVFTAEVRKTHVRNGEAVREEVYPNAVLQLGPEARVDLRAEGTTLDTWSLTARQDRSAPRLRSDGAALQGGMHRFPEYQHAVTPDLRRVLVGQALRFGVASVLSAAGFGQVGEGVVNRVLYPKTASDLAPPDSAWWGEPLTIDGDTLLSLNLMVPEGAGLRSVTLTLDGRTGLPVAHESALQLAVSRFETTEVWGDWSFETLPDSIFQIKRDRRLTRTPPPAPPYRPRPSP